MQSYREDNERMIKAQEEKNQLNATMLQILTDIQRRMNSGDQKVRPEGSKSSTRRRKISPSESSESKGSTGDSSSSSHRNEKKRHYKNHSRDEFKKEIPPTSNGEIKNGQEVESWILGIKKYFFKVHEMSIGKS